jgi:uncharacterized protein (UPF0335 family)
MSDLKSFVQRVEATDKHIDEYNDDRKSIYAEVKAAGFDVKAFKVVIAKRRKDPEKLAELATIVDLYECELASGTNDALARAPARSREAA